MVDLLLTTGSSLVLMMSMLWLLSVRLRNVSIVDIAWGPGFALIAWIAFGFATRGDENQNAHSPTAATWLLPLLTSLWGGRLAGYLAWRNHRRPEDPRYAAMRSHRGTGFWWQSLLLVFLLQGAVMWVVSLPLQFGITASAPGWTWLYPAGLAVWATGFIFETVADWQLARFKSQPANQGLVCDQGLWRYTRHPNYFGDFCVWWGLFLIAAALGAPLWTIISPLLMTMLLLKVSGVTLLERSMSSRPGYAEYVRRTSAFFPWFPRM